eukprot:COSAG01_NODE_5339_length_4325_cov_2.893043_4_plen_75_part_00
MNCRRSANNMLYFINETIHLNIVGMYVYRQQNIQPPPTTRSSMREGGCLWVGSPLCDTIVVSQSVTATLLRCAP